MKKRKFTALQVYFPEGNDSKKRLERVAKLTGFSMSRVAAMAVTYGVVKVEELLLGEGSVPVGKKSK